MPDERDDELARTATAPGGASSSGAQTPAEPLIGGSLGRYRLERELGAGGMGVVHAAFDPDLERRVALKVLRTQAAGTEAKDRLLREARAMARLAHPNVVTVHEVGTANGRDFVAMELIAGETLADWLRGERHPPHAIVEAFVAAGRGLAAAHAAGIVHRDFKPHNVLRSRDGRIVVTDFGLAREAQASLPLPLETTLPLHGNVNAQAVGTPSSLSGITVTGSVLGTPAYMAPEQWSGGAVTPATDQFAYCVALWEALVGERPYKGPTIEELRAQVARGPKALDVSKLPRRLRPILQRGLDPDPAKRWPSMDALLARLVRVESRPWIAVAIGVMAAIVATVFAVRGRGDDADPLACPAPAFDPAQVWPASARRDAGTQQAAAALVDADVQRWTTARASACKADLATRSVRLGCLDNVLGRLDIVAQAVRAHRTSQNLDAGAWLIDPAVCSLPQPPRLVAPTPELRKVITTALDLSTTPAPLSRDAAAALVKSVGSDPCAAALAHRLAAGSHETNTERSSDVDEAQQDAERCGDDRIRADTTLAAAQYALDNEWLGNSVTTKVRLAEVAADRIAQPDLVGEIDLMRATIAKRADNADEAIAREQTAIRGFAARGRLRKELTTRLDIQAIELAENRMSADQVAAVPQQLAQWRAQAVRDLGERDEAVRAIDARVVHWTIFHGDLEGAHALLRRLARELPNDPARKVTGLVVDLAGHPVAGARVTAGKSIDGDRVSAVLLTSDRDSMRTATTGPDGHFTIPDAPDRGAIIAELDDRRSSPSEIADDVRLVLEPTAQIEGKVDLAGEAPHNVIVVAKDLARPMLTPYVTIAPVAADGTFVLGGLPRGHQFRVLVSVERMAHEKMMAGTTVTAHDEVTKGLALSIAPSKRVISVLVRSTVNAPLANAQVGVLPGKVPSMSAAAINAQFHGGTFVLARHLEGEHAPKQVVAAARPGDLFATLSEVPEGVVSACAIALPELNDDEAGRKLMAHLDKLQMICTPIPDKAEVVTIEVPPLPRLD